jgi:CubicO group peptidase (beta-lactamase class C family)
MLEKHIIYNIERFVNAEITSRAHPGSSLSVIKEGEIIWSKGFGYENIKENKKAAPDTVYRCASVTKPVLTVGFLQLMEKGRFNLEDEVNSHLDVKIRDIQGDEPTLRDLLTHRSGMPTRVGPIYLLDEKPQAIKDYLESAARAIRPQGESWAYCNTGFMIIGYLIELFTGKTYDKYLTENVLKPLEMHSSVFTFKPEIQDKLAQGYKRAGGPGNTRIPVSLYQLTTKPEAPSGSMYSTVMDLGNFIIMNMDGGSFKGKRVLKKETIDEMQKLQAPSGNSRSGMGLTWFYSIHDGRIMLNHTGGLPDFTNNVCFYPMEKVGVCWLSNLQDGSGWRPPSPTVLRLVMDEKPGYGDGFHKIPENWDKICGLYGDETRQVSLGIRNGYLVFNNRMFLERITDSTYIVRGLTSDGYELTIEYDEYEKATSISYGTTTLQRYSPVIHVIDTGLTLEGTWKGEYNDSYGFHVIELEIKDEAFGTIRDAQGETVSIDEFSVMDGKVTGAFKYILPETYARWGTREYFDVRLDLSAVGGQLIGYLKSGMSTIKITFNKTT